MVLPEPSTTTRLQARLATHDEQIANLSTQLSELTTVVHSLKDVMTGFAQNIEKLLHSSSKHVDQQPDGTAPADSMISQPLEGIVGMEISQTGMTVAGTGTGTIPVMTQQQVPGTQSSGVDNNMSANVGLPQQHTQSKKYLKVWEGNLYGQRQGQPVLITKLEGYRSSLASESLAANWPPTMHIVRLISEDNMNNKKYVEKADFLVFRALTQHGFLGQMQEKKLCAVIQLPSQTLLLSVDSGKAGRLIAMLFPGFMLELNPHIQGQQPQMVSWGQVSSQSMS